jgi:TolA-binding protein
VERAAPVTRPGARRGWAHALAAGDWDRILADANRAGIKQTLAQASSDDLLALADAARYRLRGDLARDALLADRRRFPGSASALEAAYLLGRLAESHHGTVDQALQWYDVYLAGAATGPYASDALGRKMTATNGLHRADDARALAREYLRRFPGGSYAGAARALLEQGPSKGPFDPPRASAAGQSPSAPTRLSAPP